MARPFAALGRPGRTVDHYRCYLDEQADGKRVVFVTIWEARFAGYLIVCWVSDYPPFRAYR